MDYIPGGKNHNINDIMVSYYIRRRKDGACSTGPINQRDSYDIMRRKGNGKPTFTKNSKRVYHWSSIYKLELHCRGKMKEYYNECDIVTIKLNAIEASVEIEKEDLEKHMLIQAV